VYGRRHSELHHRLVDRVRRFAQGHAEREVEGIVEATNWLWWLTESGAVVGS